jgi:voltage-gated potassium channel
MRPRAILKSTVEDPTSQYGRVFALTIQWLIVISILSFATDTLPKKSEALAASLRWIECTTVMIFTVEYLLRLYVADKRFKFVFSFFGLIDLFAILPFYLSLGIDLRSLRAFRFLRLIRILKLARYSRAAQRYHRAFLIAKEEIVLFLVGAILMLFFAAVGIYYFERDAQPEAFASVFHAFWWAGCTLTTVGYGDVYPVTVGGKAFTIVILIVGLGFVAVPAGLMASSLSKARTIDDEK